MSRTSKYNIPSAVEQKFEWRAGLYIRLSREDDDIKDESRSVVSQKLILENYLNKNPEIKFVKFYIDDGYSGTNFDRPQFVELIKDINSKKVNCVIVKDLSRFGRNNIETSAYIEQLFPMLGVRLISIADNIDSNDNDNLHKSLLIAFKNIMNEEYARDISLKVRSALAIRKKRGEYLGSFGCFGYKKDVNDKHKLIIDDETAEIVKRIFNMAVQGLSIKMIAKTLNAENVPTPLEFKNARKIKFKTPSFKGNHIWNLATVREILSNQMYVGDMVQGKSEAISFKNKKKIKKPSDEWIIVQNTHEAIIDRELFNEVQNLLKKNKCFNSNPKTENILSGLCECGYCHHKLRIKNGGSINTTDKHYFICDTARISDKCINNCSIRNDRLEEIVFTAIKKHIELFLDIEKVLKVLKSNNKPSNSDNLIILKKINFEIQTHNNKLESLYYKLKEGDISRDDYLLSKVDLENRIKECQIQLNLLSQNSDTNSKEELDELISQIVKYKDISKLTRDLAVALIDKIVVYNSNKIEISFKYEDVFINSLNIIKASKI